MFSSTKTVTSTNGFSFETEEERWAYWAKHIWFSRYRQYGSRQAAAITGVWCRFQHARHHPLSLRADGGTIPRHHARPLQPRLSPTDYTRHQSIRGFFRRHGANSHVTNILVELYYVCPTGGRVLALEVVLDGIGKYFCLSLAVFLSILLGTDDDGL